MWLHESQQACRAPLTHGRHLKTSALFSPRSERLASEQDMPRRSATHGREKQGPSILLPIALGIDEHLEPGRHGAKQLQDLVVLVDVLLTVLHAFQERVVVRAQGCILNVMNEIPRVFICLTQIFAGPHPPGAQRVAQGARAHRDTMLPLIGQASSIWVFSAPFSV